MVAIEHTNGVIAPPRWNPRQRIVGFFAGVTLAALLALIAFLAHGGDVNAARFASNVVLFSASIAFALYYLAGPVSRLIRSGVTRAFGAERFALAYGFVGMMVVFIATLLMPDYLMGGRLSLPTLAYAGLTAMVCAVFLLSAGDKRAGRSVTLRSLQSLSSGYFWLAFVFTDMDRMIGPHRPDSTPYGISLLLLAIALLIRFADALMQRHIAGMSERAL